MKPRTVPWAATLVAALAVTGCTSTPEASHPPATATVAPTAPRPEPSSPEPEPTPSFSQNGSTRVLSYGNVTVEATPKSDGVHTVVLVRNTTDEPVNYDVEVSIGDGQGWVASNTFRLYQVPAKGSAKEALTVGGPHLGPIPQQPKIYIDRLATY